MFIEGLSDWEKRRLALILKERGHTAFMVIKHATAAVLSAKRSRQVNSVDQQYLTLLDTTVEELYGYQRLPNDLHYVNANPVLKDQQPSTH
ncbi:hypothetical protein [Reinekea sp.]|uniref:hypothetical protein n=1 Tax=Reinekea sp. TaxID=1970455 RepID=UPI002A80B17B|nr:hypothetical protein [Reinekea sp.]